MSAWSETKLLLELAVPVTVNSIFVGITRMISMFYIGRLTTADYLAAVALAGMCFQTFVMICYVMGWVCLCVSIYDQAIALHTYMPQTLTETLHCITNTV